MIVWTAHETGCSDLIVIFISWYSLKNTQIGNPENSEYRVAYEILIKLSTFDQIYSVFVIKIAYK